MRRQKVMRPGAEEQAAARTRRRWGADATVVSTVVAVVVTLLATEIRRFLGETARVVLDSRLLLVFTAALVASLSSVALYGLRARKRDAVAVTTGEIEIRADALGGLDVDDAVVGRSMRYLETRRRTDDLVVCLHGLGLDADDFRPYMSESNKHCIALTLYGFNTEDRNSERYPAISLETHVQLVAYALRKIKEANPRKRITLLGFSFGADMIILLAELARNTLVELQSRALILLDPNVNNATTTISSKIAEMSNYESLEDLVEILHSAGNMAEFRYLCSYLEKITSKNFAQVHRHAREVVQRYDKPDVEPFLDSLGQLLSVSKEVHVYLSLSHESILNKVVQVADSRGMDLNSLKCSFNYHFDLIRPGFMKDHVEGLLDQRPSG